MEDYTKYKLKKKEEHPVLRIKTSCLSLPQKLQEFEICDEPELTGSSSLPPNRKNACRLARSIFLCNKTTTAKHWRPFYRRTRRMSFVKSCGLGIQTVADLLKAVYAAAIRYPIAASGRRYSDEMRPCGQSVSDLTAVSVPSSTAQSPRYRPVRRREDGKCESTRPRTAPAEDHLGRDGPPEEL